MHTNACKKYSLKKRKKKYTSLQVNLTIPVAALPICASCMPMAFSLDKGPPDKTLLYGETAIHFAANFEVPCLVTLNPWNGLSVNL